MYLASVRRMPPTPLLPTLSELGEGEEEGGEGEVTDCGRQGGKTGGLERAPDVVYYHNYSHFG